VHNDARLIHAILTQYIYRLFGLVHRPVEAEILRLFLACGDLHKGIARNYYDRSYSGDRLPVD